MQTKQPPVIQSPTNRHDTAADNVGALPLLAWCSMPAWIIMTSSETLQIIGAIIASTIIISAFLRRILRVCIR